MRGILLQVLYPVIVLVKRPVVTRRPACTGIAAPTSVFLIRDKVETLAHAFPEGLICEEGAPVCTDLRCTGESLRVVDEGEGVEGELWGELAEEVAFKERGDCC
jgi:hypothetical protein